MSSPNASSRWPKCASARASRAGAEGARRDTMPGGGGALATVHSGQSQAATGQHVGSALLQPGLTCTGRTEAVLSSGARHRIWANFDRRHSSPRARSDKMLTVWKSRLVHRKRLPCEPAAGWLVVDWVPATFFGVFLDSTEYGTFVYPHSASTPAEGLHGRHRPVRVGIYCRFVNGTASATRAPCGQSP